MHSTKIKITESMFFKYFSVWSKHKEIEENITDGSLH